MSRLFKILIVLSSFILLIIPRVNAYKFEFITVGDVVKKVKERFAALDSYQANFKINMSKHGANRFQQGTIKYKASNKMLIEFSKPYGQKIVASGNRMWVYIPSMNVVAEQDLKSRDESLFGSNTRSGLTRLFSRYHYKFDGKEQPIEQKDGRKYYILHLQQKESRSGFRTLKLWIDNDYFISKAFGETSAGKHVEIDFYNIKTDVSLPNSLFRFDIPSRVRVIKNPMISEE